jgi:lysophospholipase L1-like esterase
MSALVILGDSAATGVGDQVAEGIYQGWGHYLFEALIGFNEYHNISRPGARVRELADVQIPLALEIKPKVAILIIGGNDVLRNDFNPKQMYEQLAESILKLKSIDCEVFSMNLHDPTKILPIPRILKKILKRRVSAVNDMYFALEQDYGLKVLNIFNMHEVYDLKLWHVDRMHPNKLGHQKLATYFASLLQMRGYKSNPIFIGELTQQSRLTGFLWMIKNGTPWFLKRSIDLLPVILLLTFLELFGLTDKLIPTTPLSPSQETTFQLIA